MDTREACMKRAKGTKYRLEIRESPIQGRGLFALEDIPWGKKIKEYAGTIISDKEAKKRAKKGASAIMELEENENIDGFDEGNGAAYERAPTASFCDRRARFGWSQESRVSRPARS